MNSSETDTNIPEISDCYKKVKSHSDDINNISMEIKKNRTKIELIKQSSQKYFNIKLN